MTFSTLNLKFYQFLFFLYVNNFYIFHSSSPLRLKPSPPPMPTQTLNHQAKPQWKKQNYKQIINWAARSPSKGKAKEPSLDRVTSQLIQKRMEAQVARPSQFQFTSHVLTIPTLEGTEQGSICVLSTSISLESDTEKGGLKK